MDQHIADRPTAADRRTENRRFTKTADPIEQVVMLLHKKCTQISARPAL